MKSFGIIFLSELKVGLLKKEAVFVFKTASVVIIHI
jgi:hypothetical protein